MSYSLQVTAANGNRALTLLVAVTATTISVFTVPVMTTWLIPAFQTASVSFLTILPSVILFILLPLIVSIAILNVCMCIPRIILRLCYLGEFVIIIHN
jgi:ACR3 family arsenite efflux pump ArsB